MARTTWHQTKGFISWRAAEAAARGFGENAGTLVIRAGRFPFTSSLQTSAYCRASIL